MVGGSTFNEVKAGMRDAAAVRAQYEAYWSEARGCVERALAQRPRSLFHALRLALKEFAAAHPAKRRYLRARPMAAVFAGRPLPPLAVPDFYSLMTRLLVADIVGGACDDRTERIVELGSGWGANLFFIRACSGPPDAEYAALEYTAGGREVTRMLAAVDPAMKLSVLPFDYFDADFSAFAAPKPTVVLTSHSIEQITRIGRPFLERLLSLPGLQRVVHVEPVGWQLEGPSNAVADALAGLVPPTLSWRRDFRRRARRHAYNTDLVPQLRALESEGRIAVEQVMPDHIGLNPLNPGTVIVWRPRAA
jgi:hypothetical protein